MGLFRIGIKEDELQKEEDECAEHNTNWLSGHRSNHTKSVSCRTAAKCYYPFPALSKRRAKSVCKSGEEKIITATHLLIPDPNTMANNFFDGFCFLLFHQMASCVTVSHFTQHTDIGFLLLLIFVSMT